MTATVPWLQLACGFAVGGLTGWLYFRGLRMTVERLPGSQRPGTIVLLSFLARAALALGVFLLIARAAQGHALVAAFLGFIVVRSLVVRRIRHEALVAESARRPQ